MKQRDFTEFKERHLSFWSLKNVKSPLIAFTVGAGLDSWSYWQYNKAAQSLLNRGEIKPDDINPADFVEDQLRYLELSEQINDDVCRSAMPLASVPWMEAILGCPIFSTEASMKSKEINDNIDSLELVPLNADNLWVKKYFDFIRVYENAFSKNYPVAQSILRGPSDLACALVGAENSAIALLDNPEAMHNLLGYLTDQLERFLKMQIGIIPKFHDGYVIGQYEIWAPEPAIRIQEDFSTLYSPELYNEFLKPLDIRLAGISNYTLIHLHSSSLHLIDHFLEVSTIRAFQITKDPGTTILKDILPALHKIQEAGKPLIVKGQFDKEDFDQLKNQLSVRGLCLQPVVKSLTEAKELLPKLKN
ncbi:MAG: hypothetical protein NTX65_03935 [Ignavibacteriales bacterium]|nr:hypothetical protein [Ignavibacteriales bacterium]